MLSSQYHYFELRSDSEYKRSKPSSEVVKFLVEKFGFKYEGNCCLKRNANFPWLVLTLAQSSPSGNYTSQTELPEDINLISVTASRADFNKDTDLKLLIEISELLGWELIEESDDEQMEYLVVNKPSGL